MTINVSCSPSYILKGDCSHNMCLAERVSVREICQKPWSPLKLCLAGHFVPVLGPFICGQLFLI